MDSKEFKNKTEKLKALFDKAPMKRTFGMSLEFDEQGSAIFSMPFDEKFNHSLGGIHGGVIATLLDNAGWFTAAMHYDFWIATTDLHVQLLRNASGVSLTARGRLVKFGKQLVFVRMEVTDPTDQLVAVASGTFSVTSQPFT